MPETASQIFISGLKEHLSLLEEQECFKEIPSFPEETTATSSGMLQLLIKSSNINLVACNAIERLSRVCEQEFLLSLPDFVKRINYCLAEMSGRKQIENANYLAVTQNGNDRALRLEQHGRTVEMDIDLTFDPMYGPCSFVSAVTQFYPYLNWRSLQSTQSSIMFRFLSPDVSVRTVTLEVKSTDRLIKCFERSYTLEDGKRDIIIKLSDITNEILLRDVAEICIVIRPNDVPSQKGRLIVESLGMHWSK